VSDETRMGVTLDPWWKISQHANALQRPLALWRKAVWYKANPRSPAEMRSRFATAFPETPLLDAGQDPGWASAVSGARVIVLVYPDSIGLGFGRIERQVRRAAPAAKLELLNGRGRRMALDGRTRLALRARRLLEWTMTVELVAGGILVLSTPVLLLVDLMRGRG